MKTQVPFKTPNQPARKVLAKLRKTVLRWGDMMPPASRQPEMTAIRGFLPIDPHDFACVTREKRGGRTVKNRCLRDALWFVLHYYYPTLFRDDKGCNPEFIENARLFGPKVPNWLPVAGGTQFSQINEALAAFRIRIFINGKEAGSDSAVVWAIVSRFINPFGISFKKMTAIVKNSLSRAEPCVIFVPIDHLTDHALFTYGIDVSNLYCIDTHAVGELPYWNTSGDPNRFTMEFSLEELKARWNFLGMVWSFPLVEASKG